MFDSLNRRVFIAGFHTARIRFTPCADGGALLKPLADAAKRAAAGDGNLLSSVCPEERFRSHQPRATAEPRPMNKVILTSCEVSRGKTSQRKTQPNLNERTQSAPSQ
jgi:hypothetical protein